MATFRGSGLLLIVVVILCIVVCNNALISSSSSSSSSTSNKDEEDLDEDLSFLLEEDLDEEVPSSFANEDHFGDDDDDDDIEDDEMEGGEEEEVVVDESDVVVLNEGNFSDFVEKNRYVMVEFYAPWCGHCQALTPEYAAAATQLKNYSSTEQQQQEVVHLAKVDATQANDLAQKYDVQAFPTIFFFVDALPKPYSGQRTKEAILTWIQKNTGPALSNLTTIQQAQQIVNTHDKLVIAFLDSLQGPQTDQLAAASRLEDDLHFFQTINQDVAKLFHIDPQAKRPLLLLLKKEPQKLTQFDGQFTKSAIADFVFQNKLPLVTIFTRETAPLIFENPIKKQILLFATSNDSHNLLPAFQEAANLFKGKLIFVYVEMDNEDVGRPVSEYFGVSDAPMIIAYTGNDDAKKFVLDGEVILDNIKAFGEDFLEDNLKPFFKSDPIPEMNDEDVKIVVGNNFDDIVLDESKDVLLEIYAPWCGHCQTLEPTYNKLAKHLRGVDSVVVAKMDGTTNEHPRAKADGFPTLLFFPAGNKSFDPITVDSDRTIVALYKFIKKHASIPFKLQKPVSSITEVADASMKEESNGNDANDEL